MRGCTKNPNDGPPQRISGNRQAGILALVAAVRCDGVCFAYMSVSLTQITVVPPSTTNSWPLT
jgi:hypothetical protein